MILIPIIGPSASGKTTLTRFVSEATSVPELISHTTRPRRPGEREGVEHHFYDDTNRHLLYLISNRHGSPVPYLSDGSIRPGKPIPGVLAYTYFGGYYYWTHIYDRLLFDHTNPTQLVLYIIDEDGLRTILSNPAAIAHFDAILPIYIDRNIAPPSSATSITPNSSDHPEPQHFSDFEVISTHPSASHISPDASRIARDVARHPFPPAAYYKIIHNDATLSQAKERILSIIKDIRDNVAAGDKYHYIRWFADHAEYMRPAIP